MLCVTKLRELNLLLLDNERRESPLSPLFIPLCLLFDLVYLLIRHQIGYHLIDKVQLLGLLSDRVKQLFIPLGILLMNILELIRCVLELSPELFDDLASILYFLLH